MQILAVGYTLPSCTPLLPYHFLFRTLYQDCYINEVSPTIEVYVATQFATILTEYAHLMKTITLVHSLIHPAFIIIT